MADRPKCVGCGKTDKECGEYDEEACGYDEAVRQDGTYKNNKFICTNCYVRLIPMGWDVGSPDVLMNRIEMLKKTGRW